MASHERFVSSISFARQRDFVNPTAGLNWRAAKRRETTLGLRWSCLRDGRILIAEAKHILSTLVDWKKKRDTLSAKRKLLFAKYLESPGETQLALEIKLIDDQIAECVQQMGRPEKKHQLN